MLEKVMENWPEELDLRNEEHADLINNTVDSIINQGYGIARIEAMEEELLTKGDYASVILPLSLKIAKSKIIASKVAKPLFISIIFAIYKEHNRIRKNDEHPHGEDFLVRKVSQIEWLFGDNSNINWELVVVDDGCPENSGKIAQAIVDKYNLNDRVRVVYLKDAIAHKYPPARSLQSTGDSQKGGSIIYGMWDVVREKKGEHHTVVYTDADLSTHLGQLMLLVEPLLYGDKLCAIGSRRESKSVVIKKGARNNRGKLFIYLWKRLIPNLGNIIDTQCGFKAFRAEIIPEIIDDLIEKRFAFDIELLVKTELLREQSIVKIPIAWIDSDEASTTTDLQPYLPMLKAIVKMSRKYFPYETGAEEFAGFIDSLDVDKFNKILDNIPQEIVGRNPSEFTQYDEVRAADFRI